MLSTTSHNQNHNDPSHDDKKKRDASAKSIKKSQPFHFTCPSCSYVGLTLFEQKTAYISYLLIVLLIFLFGTSFVLISCIIVSGMLLSPYYHHKCPSCSKKVASYHKILGLLNLQDKKRRIILGSFLIIVLSIIFFINLPEHLPHRGPIIPLKEKWEEFLHECGSSPLEEHGLDQRIHCRDKYLHKTVMNWKGYIGEVKDYWNPKGPIQYDAFMIYVRMLPTERAPSSDITLALDSETAKSFHEMISSLTRGTKISFNAKVLFIQDSVRIFAVLDMKKEDGFMEIPEFFHNDFRLFE